MWQPGMKLAVKVRQAGGRREEGEKTLKKSNDPDLARGEQPFLTRSWFSVHSILKKSHYEKSR